MRVCVSYIVDIYYLRESYSPHSRGKRKKEKSLARSLVRPRDSTLFLPSSVKWRKRRFPERKRDGPRGRHTQAAAEICRDKHNHGSAGNPRAEEKRMSRFAWSGDVSKARFGRCAIRHGLPVRSFITRQTIILRSALSCYTNGKLHKILHAHMTRVMT